MQTKPICAVVHDDIIMHELDAATIKLWYTSCLDFFFAQRMGAYLIIQYVCSYNNAPEYWFSYVLWSVP